MKSFANLLMIQCVRHVQRRLSEDSRDDADNSPGMEIASPFLSACSLAPRLLHLSRHDEANSPGAGPANDNIRSQSTPQKA